MIITADMSEILDQVIDSEGRRARKVIKDDDVQVGGKLIKLYYRTSKLATRELIVEFMSLAGNVWLRKLYRRDPRPIASTKTKFASLEDYLNILPANNAQSFGLVS